MKIKLAAASLPLVIFGFAAIAENAVHTSNIDRVVQQKDLTHESLQSSLFTPQGGGICNGCVVKFIDTHGK